MSNLTIVEVVTPTLVKIYDNYGSSFLSFDNIPDCDLVLLKILSKHTQDYSGQRRQREMADDILDHVQETRSGIMIRKSFYNWNEIQDIFNHEN